MTRDPLRKIVSEYTDHLNRTIEVLECGHEQARKSDMYGLTNAYRRRCHKCACANHPLEAQR